MLAVLLAAGVALGPQSGENRLRFWLESDSFTKRLSDFEETPFQPIFDPELRDSVSDAPSAADLKRRIEEAQSDKRRALAARLPGMNEPDAKSCLTLADCAIPPLSLDAPARGDVRQAVRSLLRPWLLLRRVVRVEAGQGEDQLLLMTIPDFGLKKVAVRIAPKPGGGFRLYFDQALALAHLYDIERAAAFAARR